MAKQKPHYIAKVSPAAGRGFLGEVIEQETGNPAGFSSRCAKHEDAKTDAVHAAQALNEYDVRYDG